MQKQMTITFHIGKQIAELKCIQAMYQNYNK